MTKNNTVKPTSASQSDDKSQKPKRHTKILWVVLAILVVVFITLVGINRDTFSEYFFPGASQYASPDCYSKTSRS